MNRDENPDFFCHLLFIFTMPLLPTAPPQATLSELEAFTTHVEQALWHKQAFETDLAQYQQHFQQIEACYQQGEVDNRYHFLVVMPIADRPLHLQHCLHSLQQQLKLYGYGQGSGGNKVKVLITDDSKDPKAIQAHQDIADDFCQQGLSVSYFGQAQQRALLADLPEHFQHIVGETQPQSMAHKGASISRNLTYLKLKQYENPQTLFYFIDSDQEFNTLVNQHGKALKLDAINFFYHLDQIFRKQNVEVLTGKVVGDPPVAPAVMAGNFLTDLQAFFTQLGQNTADYPCPFHPQQADSAEDAAYHDMADLFGFKAKNSSFDYACTLGGTHDQAACLADFSQKLQRFFDGEHPTRKSYFNYRPASELSPARTIYTGNYVFKPSALMYFIPFAPLKLRMAGPVLGRILQAELAERFVSSNLPMLHKRTVDELGSAEFRAGVSHEKTQIDLSAEFERQYFGDVMLFSIISLCEQGFPQTCPQHSDIEQLVQQIHTQMQEKYQQKQANIIESLQALKIQIKINGWWQTQTETMQALQQFLNSIAYNFDKNAPSYQLIARSKTERLKAITAAIAAYPDIRQQWSAHLKSLCDI